MLNTFSTAILNRLPAESRVKAVILDHHRQAAHAAFEAAGRRLDDAFRRQDAMEMSINERIANTPKDRRHPDEIDALLAPLKVIDAEIAGLKVEVERAERAFQAFDFLFDAAKWLGDRDQIGRTFKHRKLPAVKGDFRKIVDDARARVIEITDKMEAIDLAPAPAAVVANMIRAEIDRLAEQGRPTIDQRSPSTISEAIARAVATPSFAIFAGRAALIEALTADLKDAPGAMTDEQKAAAIADLDTDRLEAERIEEAATIAAAKAETVIPRRRGISALAVLELE